MPEDSPAPQSSPPGGWSDAWTHRLFDNIYEAYNQRDSDATRDCYAPDLTVTINGRAGPGDREAFVRALEEQWRGFPDVTATEADRLVAGDAVVTEMVIDGHNSAPFLGRAPTGKRWHVTLAWVCEVREGRVAAIRTYIDNRSIQEAVWP